MLSQQFIDYLANLGLHLDHNPKDPIAPITLYVDIENKQAYKHFGSEEDAIEYIKNGWFFGNQGIWGDHINKFPDRCVL